MEAHVDVARALEDRYGFKVWVPSLMFFIRKKHSLNPLLASRSFSPPQLTGVPTLFFLKPQADGSKKRIPYDGDRSRKDLYDQSLQNMPDYTTFVSDASFERFRTQDMPTALLVTEKPTTPAIWKVCSWMNSTST